MENIFSTAVSEQVIARIHQLNSGSQPQWGKMNVAQMLAHCNVTYALVYDQSIPKSNAFTKFLLKLFVKKAVVSETPFKKSSATAPIFIIKDAKEFDAEKQKLVKNIQKTQALGENHFEGKESHSFGKLTSQEWNNMFYKHLDHHLRQFGV
ncbi:MAG: DUF1569 domain-containing protein [Sphingobacteriaceae bacterium]|nr:DUF1569 domain-containing protein [Sphingobacteriaceae bacterium]